MFRYPQYCQPCTCCRNKSKNVRLRHQYVNGSTQQTRERRNVIATGMKRFETKVEIRNQPQVESLSKSVTCILGGNPSEYTINGTNCYLVGCGTSRILVDCAEKYIGNSAFMKNLEKAMEITGTKSICAVIITHLHHDHYGGIYSVQKRYGPGIPVYKSEVPNHWWDTLNGIVEKNMLHHFVRSDGTLRFHPKRDLTKSGENMGDPRATQRSEAFFNKPPRTDIPEFDFLETELGYDKNQRQVLPFMFSFMYDAYTFMNDLRTGKLIWRKLERGTKIRTPDGSASLICFPTPGHSPDHCAFVLENENALLSGDHVLGQGTTVVQDMYEYMKSLDLMVNLSPTRLYPGHGCYVVDGLDLLQRYVAHRLERENQVWNLLRNTSSILNASSIAQMLYTNTSKERIHLAAENVYKICSSLFRKGQLSAQIRHSEKKSEWVELKPEDIGPFDRVRPYLVRGVHWRVVDDEEGRLLRRRRAKF